MKILFLFLLLPSSLVFGSTLWKDELTCIKTAFLKSGVKAVLSEAIDSSGLDRSLNNIPTKCEQRENILICNNPSDSLKIDISKRNYSPGIPLPLGGVAGSYYYYDAKLISKSFGFFFSKVKCRGEIIPY